MKVMRFVPGSSEQKPVDFENFERQLDQKTTSHTLQTKNESTNEDGKEVKIEDKYGLEFFLFFMRSYL